VSRAANGRQCRCIPHGYPIEGSHPTSADEQWVNEDGRNTANRSAPNPVDRPPRGPTSPSDHLPDQHPGPAAAGGPGADVVLFHEPMECDLTLVKRSWHRRPFRRYRSAMPRLRQWIRCSAAPRPRRPSILLIALVTTLTCVIGLSGPGLAPANAAGSDNPRSIAASGPAAPYVQADSPEEALKLLDATNDDAPDTASPMATTPKYGPCVLYPTRIHLRTSSNRETIGFKPETKCTVSVTSIRHDSDLRYKYLAWWRKSGTWSGSNRGERSYTQKNMEHRCSGTRSTTWSGTTLGTVVFQGKTYYSRVYPPTTSLPCKP